MSLSGKGWLALSLWACWGATATARSSATTITFDDLAQAHFDPTPTSYDGLEWTNFYDVDGTWAAGVYGSTGFTKDVVSPQNLVSDGFQAPATITAQDGGVFTFTSAYLGSFQTIDLPIDVTATDVAGRVIDHTIVVGQPLASLYTFNWADVHAVTLAPQGDWFTADNITVDLAPEASSLFTFGFLLGAGGLLAVVRRRR